MKILIVDDEPAARYGMAKALRSNSRSICEAANGNEALQSIRDDAPDLVFLDLNMPEKDGLSVLRDLQQSASMSVPEIIVVTANDTVDHAVKCVQAGATDFLTKPYDVEHLRSIARRSEERVRLQQQVAELQQKSADGPRFGRLLGISPAMQKLFGQIDRAAVAELPVLLRGESGTGKELVARELHDRSARSEHPFVAVNTAAIADSLVESELFGHVKGAFTGADRERTGVFRKAHRGTLFLDEIGDMPAGVQTRLLRVLQEGVVQPVGTEQTVVVDVRVISATHQDLDQSIARESFRQDLYFRLKGIELFLPPLRSRREDILLLARSFAGECDFSGDAVAALLQHSWPGNVRELQQTVSAAIAMCDEETLTAAELRLITAAAPPESEAFAAYYDQPLTEARNQLVEEFERSMIRHALQMEQKNVSAAARRLGIHRQSLQQKMKQLGLR